MSWTGCFPFHMHERHRLFNEEIEVLLPCDEVTESDLEVSFWAAFIPKL